MRERKAAGGLFNWEVGYSFFFSPFLFVAPESILQRAKTKINGPRSSLMPCKNQFAISQTKVLLRVFLETAVIWWHHYFREWIGLS